MHQKSECAVLAMVQLENLTRNDLDVRCETESEPYAAYADLISQRKAGESNLHGVMPLMQAKHVQDKKN